MKKRTIGIMGAMPEEILSITDLLTQTEEIHLGGRTYYKGYINDIQVVVVFSKWGKVAASITVSTLILEFKISELIFTGVAGAIDPSLKIGDIVLGKRFIQHDLDARPLIPQFEVPLLQKKFIETPDLQFNKAQEIIEKLLEEKHLHSVITDEELLQFNITHPTLHIGDIASGDQFFSSNKAKEHLLQLIPSTLCVEMEGAAVAQVCYEFQIPFTIIRTISDAADEDAKFDFSAFIEHISNKYSKEIIKLYMQE